MARRKVASLYRDGRTWYVSYWKDGERVRESTGTESRKVAEEVRCAKEREMILGDVDVSSKLSIALQDPSRREAILAILEPGALVAVKRAYREYITHSRAFKRPKTVSSDRGRLKEFFRAVAVRHVSDVTTRHANEYFASKKKRDHSADTTLLRIREILHAFYEFARKQGYVKANPIDGVPRPRLSDRDIRFLALEDIDGCLKAVAGDLIEGVVATAIYAGLRREELCWLRWEDIDVVYIWRADWRRRRDNLLTL